MKTFIGLNGSISVNSEKVILHRGSGIDSVFHEEGNLTIPFSNIAEVIYSEGGLTNGYITILRYGDKRPHGILSALRNATTVIFRFTKNRQALEMTEYVNSRI